MNFFENIPNNINSSKAYSEYIKFNKEKNIQENYYRERPLEQNAELILEVEKFQKSIEETSRQNNLSIKIMIVTLVISFISMIISAYSLFINK